MYSFRSLGLTVTLFVVASSPVVCVGQEKPAAGGGAEPASTTLFSSSKGGRTQPKPSKTEAPVETAVATDGSYRVGVEDELTISVWHEPELSGPVVVRPDGVITLPLLNDVHVVGMTTKELQTFLTDKLTAFVTAPQVTVIVRSIKSRKVYLMGQVSRPGAYPLNGSKTLLELLAETGGLGPFAKAKSIYVMRENGGKRVRLDFNYKKAMASGSPADDIVLLPGDRVVVP